MSQRIIQRFGQESAYQQRAGQKRAGQKRAGQQRAGQQRAGQQPDGSTLRREIALNRDFVSLDEEVLLSLVTTNLCLTRLGYAFFDSHEITDAQFNALMILRDYRERGIRQFELSEALLVNRASAGSLIDRMSERGWVQRLQDPADRRSNFVEITPEGERALRRVRGPYYRLLPRAFQGFGRAAKRELLAHLERFRGNINAIREEILGAGKNGAGKSGAINKGAGR